jgi:hypothetical protein
MPEKVKAASKTVSFKVPHLPQKFWVVSTLFLLVASVALLFRGQSCTTGAVSAADAGAKAVAYINNNLISSGSATLVSAVDAGVLYKVTTAYNGNNIDTYVTKDGTQLFVSSPYDMDAAVATTTTQPKKTCADMPKAAASQLDAFVVAGCPYGLQMQRILAEIVSNVPSLADSITVRYIGAVENGKITAMHGDAEAQENLRQICIREEQAAKYWDYVSCYIKASGSTDSCLASAAVDTTKLNTCMTDATKGLVYAQADFDKAGTYSVSGSPTLIMNGQTVSEFDFGGRTADAVKTLLCCGFSAQPSACSTALITAQAATSFSATYAGTGAATGSAANCG